MRRRILLLAAACTASASDPAIAHRTELNVSRIAQQTPSWCWAATASMALKYLGFPDINEVKNYQCGVVAATYPVCADDCTRCDTTLDRMPSFVALLERYKKRSSPSHPDRLRAAFQPNYVAYPDFVRIKESIDQAYPVIGGISGAKPPSPTQAEHAILITGYDDDYRGTGEPWVAILDPYPYARGESPWVKAGYSPVRTNGKTLVPWRFMRERMNLDSAVFLERRTA